MAKSEDKWVERWVVKSSPNVSWVNGVRVEKTHNYIIGKDANGNYGCSCPGWTRQMFCPICGSIAKTDNNGGWRCGHVFEHPIRHDCKHIVRVKDGLGQSLGEAILERMTEPW